MMLEHRQSPSQQRNIMFSPDLLDMSPEEYESIRRNRRVNGSNFDEMIDSGRLYPGERGCDSVMGTDRTVARGWLSA